MNNYDAFLGKTIVKSLLNSKVEDLCKNKAKKILLDRYHYLSKNVIMHYGKKGMHWGIRNVYYKSGEMSQEEYIRACDLWNKTPEFPGLSRSEKEWVYENFDNNLSDEEKTFAIVSRPFDNYHYTAIHKGHNQYKIIDRERVEPPRNWEEQLDDILTEVVGKDWRQYNDW